MLGVGALRTRMASAAYTYGAFCVALAALPALAFSYVVVHVSTHFWLKILSNRYPHLDFIKTDTMRSLMDTHRNQGIINVVLCVKGPLEAELIRQHLEQHVITKRDNRDRLMFPRLRAVLVSCWGNYAWDENVPFRLDNHFQLSSGVYRGRPITDHNLQDYVSEIVAKYFPSDLPPWQFIVIPCVSTESKYYILVRVHHLLLTGQNSINIGDLLLVEQSTEAERAAALSAEQSQLASPLTRLFPAPSAIPELFEKIGESVSNAWNEFVSEYDPVESPRALKSPTGMFHCAGLVLIATASAMREVNKRRSATHSTLVGAAATAALLLSALRYECRRRNLTITKVLFSPLVTLDPRKWPPRILRLTICVVKLSAMWPLRLRDELAALKALRDTGHATYPDTLAWRWAELGRLAARALAEAWRGAAATYRAPAQLWNDAVRADDGHRHALQTTSLCGRKVAAWSRPIPRSSLESVARALRVSATDVALYAAAEAVHAHLQHAHLAAPPALLTTARAATQDFLFAFAEGDGKDYKKSQTGGMICIALPLGASPRGVSAVVERACRRQGALAGVWAAQARCGALTRALPSPLSRVLLNVMSRRYAVSFAEISAPSDARPRRTLWGHQLEHIVYWRPPQANISMTLTVIQYADTVRLAVMTDAQISPAHTVTTAQWPDLIDQLVARIEQQTLIRPKPDSQERRKDSQERRKDITGTVPERKGEAHGSGLLKPPATHATSPPPVRRRVAQE